MKKIFGIVAIFLFAITLVTCNKTATHSVTEVINALEIVYMQGDSFDHVTQNIGLPVRSELERTAKISWESSNKAVISDEGIVYRPIEDTNITLLVSVTLGSSVTQKFFDLRVIGTTLLGNYTVEIYIENLEDEAYTLDSSEYLTAEIGSEINIHIAKTGFIVNDELSTLFGTVESNTDGLFKAYFDRIEYQVLFYDEENLLSSNTLKYQNSVEIIMNPIKENYLFLGWASMPISDSYFVFGQPISQNISLYAQWEFLNSDTYDGYYLGFEGLSEDALVSYLRNLVNRDMTRVSYGDVRYILDETDQDPNNPEHVITIYDRQSVSNVWTGLNTSTTYNREHVWPNSRLGVPSVNNSSVNIASDLHNLRAAIPATNSSRSNKIYDFITTEETYYPGDSDRGDVARMILYMFIAYTGMILSDNILPISSEFNYLPEGRQMGRIYALLQWHNQDPVDSFEINRNQIIYQYQNNRNPFIDHPEFVELIWGPTPISDDNSLFLNFQINPFILIMNHVLDMPKSKYYL